eukprot:CFRG3605T1
MNQFGFGNGSSGLPPSNEDVERRKSVHNDDLHQNNGANQQFLRHRGARYDVGVHPGYATLPHHVQSMPGAASVDANGGITPRMGGIPVDHTLTNRSFSGGLSNMRHAQNYSLDAGSTSNGYATPAMDGQPSARSSFDTTNTLSQSRGKSFGSLHGQLPLPYMCNTGSYPSGGSGCGDDLIFPDSAGATSMNLNATTEQIGNYVKNQTQQQQLNAFNQHQQQRQQQLFNIGSSCSSVVYQNMAQPVMPTVPLHGMVGKGGVIESQLQSTNNQNIVCSKLPSHWRCNKSFLNSFLVYALCHVPDGTECVVHATNEEQKESEMKNSTATMHNGVATFDDLRFVGRSGRGKALAVSVHIHTEPVMIAQLYDHIKITVDGPREPRRRVNRANSTDTGVNSSGNNSPTAHNRKSSLTGSASGLSTSSNTFISASSPSFSVSSGVGNGESNDTNNINGDTGNVSAASRLAMSELYGNTGSGGTSLPSSPLVSRTQSPHGWSGLNILPRSSHSGGSGSGGGSSSSQLSTNGVGVVGGSTWQAQPQQQVQSQAQHAQQAVPSSPELFNGSLSKKGGVRGRPNLSSSTSTSKMIHRAVSAPYSAHSSSQSSPIGSPITHASMFEQHFELNKNAKCCTMTSTDELRQLAILQNVGGGGVGAPGVNGSASSAVGVGAGLGLGDVSGGGGRGKSEFSIMRRLDKLRNSPARSNSVPILNDHTGNTVGISLTQTMSVRGSGSSSPLGVGLGFPTGRRSSTGGGGFSNYNRAYSSPLLKQHPHSQSNDQDMGVVPQKVQLAHHLPSNLCSTKSQSKLQQSQLHQQRQTQPGLRQVQSHTNLNDSTSMGSALGIGAFAPFPSFKLVDVVPKEGCCGQEIMAVLHLPEEHVNNFGGWNRLTFCVVLGNTTPKVKRVVQSTNDTIAYLFDVPPMEDSLVGSDLKVSAFFRDFNNDAWCASQTSMFRLARHHSANSSSSFQTTLMASLGGMPMSLDGVVANIREMNSVGNGRGSGEFDGGQSHSGAGMGSMDNLLNGLNMNIGVGGSAMGSGGSGAMTKDSLLEFMMRLYMRYQDYKTDISVMRDGDGDVGAGVDVGASVGQGAGGTNAGACVDADSDAGVGACGEDTSNSGLGSKNKNTSNSGVFAVTRNLQFSSSMQQSGDNSSAFMLQILSSEEKVLELARIALVKLSQMSQLPAVDASNTQIQQKLGFDPVALNGATVLHLAAGFGWKNIAERLLAGGSQAFINQFDAFGNTPADWAFIHKHNQLLAYIQSCGGQQNRSAFEQSSRHNGIYKTDETNLSGVLNSLNLQASK